MKKPGWLKDAIATESGFISSRGEMLKRKKMTQEEIDAWNGSTTPINDPAPVVLDQEIIEEPSVEIIDEVEEDGLSLSVKDKVVYEDELNEMNGVQVPGGIFAKINRWTKG